MATTIETLAELHLKLDDKDRIMHIMWHEYDKKALCGAEIDNVIANGTADCVVCVELLKSHQGY